MLSTMSNTTRNAPFGTDDTPNLQMKIVGGKRVQIAIDSTNNESSNDILNKSWPLPRIGPHGTPSILTQPNWEAYDSRLQSGFNTSDQHNLARNVSSYTSPMGDRSHSFKHGLPVLNTKAVLPPIATQSAGPHVHMNQQMLSSLNSNSHEFEESTTLEEQVEKQLKKFSAQKLKNMYIDLTTYDRKLTGLVTESQFSLISLRHDLPLKLSILKIIYAKFVDFKDPSMINYEKILQFLSDCINQTILSKSPTLLNTGHTRTRTSPPDFRDVVSPYVPLIQQNPKSMSNMQGPNDGHVSQLGKEADEKLVELISAQLSPKQNLEIDDLIKSFQELDRLEKGMLPIHVVKSTCIRHQLPFTSSILMKLLQRSETTAGMADWKLFLEPLKRIHQMRQIPNGSDMETDMNHSSEINKISSSVPWERKPLGQIGNISSKQEGRVPEPNRHVSASSFPSSLPSTSSTINREIPQLPDGWDEHQPVDRDDNVYVSPRQTEPWYNKFNKLSHALRTYHPYNAEVLVRDDAERMTKNYNLIYGLGFSEKKIENAVQQSIIPRKDGSPGNKVSVNALLELLEGKKRLLA
uniref:uncharacterized protein C1orf87 homolog isoform X2 n=1 Tax=Styela clava TaxID=7725 RepID=UPI001939A33E|nr:uncharacterized protein C1orf87 homolog isoform X2 [Styela clava]